MPVIRIALQEGFSNDDVAVKVAGREVLRESGVKTRMQVGLAKSLEVEVPVGSTEIAVDVPTRAASALIQVDVAANVYVGISITEDGRITHKVSKEPFRYA